MVNDERMLAILLAALGTAKRVSVVCAVGKTSVPPAHRLDLLVGVVI